MELACTGWTTSPVCLRASSDCTVLLLDFSALMSQQTLTCPCRMRDEGVLDFSGSKLRLLEPDFLRH